MAGRILPVALATVVGVSIGVATFDGEFKEQRRKKLEEEYKRYVAAAHASAFTHGHYREVAAQSALASQSVTPMASNAIPPPSPQSIPTPIEPKKEEASSWSSLLGLWAWKKDAKNESVPAAQKPDTSQEQTEEASGKP